MIRILLIFTFFINILFANVILKAPSSFISGEPLKFEIEYRGSEEPSFPNIEKIENFRVASAGRSNQISIINGNRSQVITQSYIFYPNKDITIPPFEIKTKSQVFKTKEKKISMNVATKTKSKDFDLSLSVDKNSLYVGESLILTLKFKYRLGINILNMELNKPSFDGFWAKTLGQSVRAVEGEYEIHTLKYLLFPQREGKRTLEPISINIALQDDSIRSYSLFRSPAKVRRFYSNKIDLDVKPLPDNLKLIGDFKITSSVDKTSVKLGEAISYKVQISGSGNLDDIEDIKLEIPNATIYENKPLKKFEFKDGKYSGIYTKTFSIVGNTSFKIDAIKLSYFDINEKIKKETETKSYDIDVTANVQVANNHVLEKIQTKAQEKVIVKTTSKKDKVIFFVLGMISGVLLIVLLYYIKLKKVQKKEDDKPLVKVVKKLSNKNELLRVLAPYLSKDKQLDSFIYTLEKSEQKDFKNIKKDILTILKKTNF